MGLPASADALLQDALTLVLSVLRTYIAYLWRRLAGMGKHEGKCITGPAPSRTRYPDGLSDKWSGYTSNRSMHDTI